METIGGSSTPSLYIHRPLESVELVMHAQRIVREVLGGSPVFLPRRGPSVSLLREPELYSAFNRSPALRQQGIDTIRSTVMQALPESSNMSIPAEPEDIIVLRGIRRHLAITLESDEIAEEREAIIGALADLGDTPVPWTRGRGHISLGSFARPVTPRTLGRIQDALAENLPNVYLLGRVDEGPAIRSYFPKLPL